MTLLDIIWFAWFLVLSKIAFSLSLESSRNKKIVKELLSKVRGLSLVVKVLGSRLPD